MTRSEKHGPTYAVFKLEFSCEQRMCSLAGLSELLTTGQNLFIRTLCKRSASTHKITSNWSMALEYVKTTIFFQLISKIYSQIVILRTRSKTLSADARLSTVGCTNDYRNCTKYDTVDNKIKPYVIEYWFPYMF